MPKCSATVAALSGGNMNEVIAMPSTCDQPRPASRSAALPASYSSFCTVSGERLA